MKNRIREMLFIAMVSAISMAQPAFAAAPDKAMPDNGIPVVVIEIDEQEGHTIDDMNASSDHSVECYGTMQINVPAGFQYCDQNKEVESLGPVQMEHIRGRGNSTWEKKKKPYKIKLEKKADVLGLGKNKHWVLMANVLDPTGFKNRFSAWLGHTLGFEFTPMGVPVDLVMVAKKDGREISRKNLGSYLLAEQVRVGKGRLNINELSPKDTDPEDITGGYLIQFGSQVEDTHPNKFYTDRGVNLANHTPTFDPEDSDYTNEVQKEYIRDYIQKMENAMFGEGVNQGDPFTGPDGVRYNQYMDMESAALYWLVQEASCNADMYTTGSNYFYKKEDNGGRAGKIFWGPLWDFDQAWSLPGTPGSGYTGFHLKSEWLLPMIYDDDQNGFRKTAQRVWPTFRDSIRKALETGGLIDQYYAEMNRSISADYLIWKDILPDDYLASRADYAGSVDDFKSWIRNRLSWMDAHMGGNSPDQEPDLDHAVCRVSYVSDGQIVHREYYRKGGRCKLFVQGADNDDVFIPEKEGQTFLGWMREDGSLITENQDIESDTAFYAKYSN